MRNLLILPLLLLSSAAAHAEITDVRARAFGHEGQIFIGFDSQPTAVTVDSSAQGARLHVEGVSAAPRRLSPAHDGIVRSLLLETAEGGLNITLTASGLWDGAEAQIYQDGIVVTLHLSEPAPARTHLPSTPAPSPAPTPAHSTTPAPANSHAAADSHAATEAAPGPVVAPAETSHAPASPSARQTSAHEAAPEPAAPSASIQSADACEAAARAVADNPWDDAALIRHAVCLREDGHLTEAGGIYEQMLTFEPENAAIAYALAEVREAQGDEAAAARYYRQSATHARSDAAAAAAINRARALEGH